MIWRWIANGMWWMLWLINPKTPPRERRFDFGEACPSCGWRGKLAIETVIVTTSVDKVSAMRKARLEVRCGYCSTKFYRRPLCGEDATILHGREIVGL
jgi:hypothetical protein